MTEPLTGDGLSSPETSTPFSLKLPGYKEQTAVLGALTSYIAIQGHTKDGTTPAGKSAQALFSKITHHIDDLESQEDKEFVLDLGTQTEQDALKSALFFKVHQDTTAEMNGHLKPNDKSNLSALRGYYRDLVGHHRERLSETELLGTGLVDEISIQRLEEISDSTDPSYAGLKPYANYFLKLRKQ